MSDDTPTFPTCVYRGTESRLIAHEVDLKAALADGWTQSSTGEPAKTRKAKKTRKSRAVPKRKSARKAARKAPTRKSHR